MKNKVHIGVDFLEKVERFIAHELKLQHTQVVVNYIEHNKETGDILLSVELQHCEPTV